MSEPLTFTVQLSFEDYLDANRAVLWRAWNPKTIAVALLRMATIVVTMLVLFALIAGENPLRMLADAPLLVGVGGAVALAVCFIFQWVRLRSSARKMFDQLGTVELPTTYTLSREQFEASYAQGNSIHPWSQFMDYVESDRVILLRRTAGMFFGIPKAQLDPATLGGLTDLLRAVKVKRG